MIYAIIKIDILQDRLQSLTFRKENQGNRIASNIVTYSLPIDKADIEKMKLLYPIGANWKTVTNRKRIANVEAQMSAPPPLEISTEAKDIVKDLS